MSMKKFKQEKRPSSDDFVELHVFVVPYELWMEKYRTAYNSSTLESISAGFVRVPPHLTLEDLRFQIKEQLSCGDVLPEEYVFLRSVGRCLAIVNKVQELSLKVKHFLPPIVSSPEIFVLFGNHESLSHTLASSINTTSDFPEYEKAQGYLKYSGDVSENSRCTLLERDKTEDLDEADVLQRRVHFHQNNESKNEKVDDSEKTIVGNVVTKDKGTYLTELPQTTKSKTSEEQEQVQHLSNSGLDKQKSRVENRRLSPELPVDQNVQHNQENSNEVNGIQSHENAVQIREKRHDSGDSRRISSNFEEQHARSPLNKVQKKNPLLHSKTAPSLLPTSYNESMNEENNEGNKQNERSNETVSESEQNAGIFNNKEQTENERSNGYPDHLELNHKNEIEAVDRTREDYELATVLESDGKKHNYHIRSANENGENVDQTKVADSTNGNIKHSADHSVASSGFESLNQPNNENRHEIERDERDFGVTIADKENLVLQLQAELNAVRSERSTSEKAREQLLKKAKNLQNQTNQKRKQAKSVWKKRYFEEKKKTVSLEERCNQLRYEVEVIHKRILSSVDSKDRDSATAYLNKDEDPKKLNAKIALARKENGVEELRRRVEEAKIKLGAEMKLRDNAQKELKQIRDEVIDKKINATLVKKSLSLLETRPSDT